MKYLIRILEKNEYVEELLSGQLNMYPAGKYMAAEMGVYPDSDGNVSLRFDFEEGRRPDGLWQDLQAPVLSLIEVDTSSDSGDIGLDVRIVRDFCPKGGFAVIFPFEVLQNHMTPLLKKYPTAYCGSIQYDADDYICDKDSAAVVRPRHPLMHKRVEYAYQSEYRYVFPDTGRTIWLNEPMLFDVPWRPTIDAFDEKDVNVANIPPFSELQRSCYFDLPCVGNNG